MLTNIYLHKLSHLTIKENSHITCKVQHTDSIIGLKNEDYYSIPSTSGEGKDKRLARKTPPRASVTCSPGRNLHGHQLIQRMPWWCSTWGRTPPWTQLATTSTTAKRLLMLGVATRGGIIVTNLIFRNVHKSRPTFFFGMISKKY